MEKRKRKVIIVKTGGNASENALNYKISLPTNWMNEMNITTDSRQVEMSFDGRTIVIKKINNEGEE